MNKKIKIIIAILLVITVCIIGFCTFKNLSRPIDVYVEANNVTENTLDSNIVEENVTNENEIQSQNSIDEEIAEPEVENPTEIVPSSSVYESNTDVGTTNKKQEAIELVKQKWGEDSTVTFRCDSVTTDGEYIIAVVSLETASVRNYFKVNLESKTVTVDY